MIREALPDDALQVAEIYNHYVLRTVVTFETEAVTKEQMSSRITETKTNYPWLVFEENTNILGYGYATRWKTRAAYDLTVESAVYVAHDQTGKGIGGQLLQALVDELKLRGFHAALGGIALPNEQSIHLHEKHGFEKVGQLKEVGYKLGQRVDVGYWELILA